jgi:hypothetical protein
MPKKLEEQLKAIADEWYRNMAWRANLARGAIDAAAEEYARRSAEQRRVEAGGR